MATPIFPLHGATSTFTRDDGRALAVQLLRELDVTQVAEDCQIEDVAPKPPGAQRNILNEYLEAIERTGSADLRAGFTSILTDFIASAASGVVMNADCYEGQEA